MKQTLPFTLQKKINGWFFLITDLLFIINAKHKMNFNKNFFLQMTLFQSYPNWKFTTVVGQFWNSHVWNSKEVSCFITLFLCHVWNSMKVSLYHSFVILLFTFCDIAFVSKNISKDLPLFTLENDLFYLHVIWLKINIAR